jgi:DNA-3-methyladenine glycosylase II
VLARLIDDRPAFDPRAWMAERRRWTCTVPRCSRSPASSFRRGDPPDPGPHPGAVRWPSSCTRRTLGVDPEKLREAGLSWRKIGTLRDLAERLSDGRLDPDVLRSLPDDELMAELTAIPGIGPWTVQGAMIIALQREDVVLPGDLALRKAVQVAYQLDHLPSQQEVLAIAEKWRPYRSLATSYLFSAAFERTEARPVVPHETSRSSRLVPS